MEGLSGQLARETVEKFPRATSLLLARKLKKKHPEVYATVENARSAVRSIRGAIGDEHRKEKQGRTIPRIVLPDSHPVDYSEHVVNGNTILVIADLHIPYHDNTALMCALEYGQKVKCDTVYIDGDMLDFHRLSRFIKDPRMRSAREEIDAANVMLDTLKKLFKHVIWKQGNHEERYDHYIMQHAPEIWDIDAVHLPQLMNLKERGIEWVGHKRVSRIGKHLSVIHGHEHAQSIFSPVNAARGLFLRAKACAVCAHSHQTSEHTEPTIQHKLITTWSVGAMCQLHPQYMPLNKWNHGFAIIRTDGDDFEVENRRIIAGKLV